MIRHLKVTKNASFLMKDYESFCDSWNYEI